MKSTNIQSFFYTNLLYDGTQYIIPCYIGNSRAFIDTLVSLQLVKESGSQFGGNYSRIIYERIFNWPWLIPLEIMRL